MQGEPFWLGMLAIFIVVYITEPPHRMSGPVLVVWWLGLLAVSTLVTLGITVGGHFGSTMLISDLVLVPMFAMLSLEMIKRGRRN